MKFARIDLNKTNYGILPNCRLITEPDTLLLDTIFRKYCRYKKFDSVMPLFEYQYKDINSDIYGYYNDENNLIAFTLIRKLDKINVENCQFAWDYEKPELRLGIESLKNECAIYKKYGYRYMYLGYADEYKKQLDGFEILGPL